MKASLEPKEQQIESLKEQLLDLEKVFEIQTAETQNLQVQVDKRAERHQKLQQELFNEKARARAHEKTISDFIGAINTIVQKKDEKQYIQGLMHLYNQFVKPLSDEIQQQKQKDPEIIEELDRQLKYMEKTISSFRGQTQKNHAKSLNNIKKRTTDNKALIDELS